MDGVLSQDLTPTEMTSYRFQAWQLTVFRHGDVLDGLRVLLGVLAHYVEHVLPLRTDLRQCLEDLLVLKPLVLDPLVCHIDLVQLASQLLGDGSMGVSAREMWLRLCADLLAFEV